MRLSFFGGARTVGGVNYLLEIGERKILIDCGLFGDPIFKIKNKKPFPYSPEEIDAVIITHSHLDHTGRLANLVKEGFRGKIFATPATVDLIKLILDDLLELSAESRRNKNRDNSLPFSQKDLTRTLNFMEPVEYHKQIEVFPEISFNLLDAGHILGSAIVELYLRPRGIEKDFTKVIISGDLGNPPTPLLRPTEFPDSGDYILIETTYGNKIHKDFLQRKDSLEDVIEETIREKGVLMIPAFAVERTQELLYELNELVENHRIPRVPIFIDSPMAIKAVEIYKKYQRYYNKEAAYILKSGDDIFNFPNLTFTKEVRDSKAIEKVAPPKIIIAGSGTSEGGRILHHEKKYLSSSRNCLLLICYQTKGTRGRKIQDGAKTVEMPGEVIPVKAKIKQIQGYSAHADRNTLFRWLYHIKSSTMITRNRPVKKVFVVQGEEEPARDFAQLVNDRLGIEAVTPSYGQTFNL